MQKFHTLMHMSQMKYLELNYFLKFLNFLRKKSKDQYANYIK
jgi:hypothetical protein